jgi:hypothetical protein
MIKNSNIVNNKNNLYGKRTNTGLDNGRTVEDKTISILVGGQQEAKGISRTIEASNIGGNTSTILTSEEREELESRGINPDWNKSMFLKKINNNG